MVLTRKSDDPKQEAGMTRLPVLLSKTILFVPSRLFLGDLGPFGNVRTIEQFN